MNKYSTNRTAIVIGAGIAGIASAIRLQALGFKVEVYEQNSYPGGKLAHFTLGEFHFDAGPSLFTQPENIKELFELADENMNNYFQYQQMPVSCTYFYEDGTRVKAYSNNLAFANELAKQVGEPAENTISYLQQSAKIYNNIGTLFLNNSLHKMSTLFKKGVFKALKYTKWKYLFKSMNELHEQHFSSPKTVQLFNRYATYNGSNPYKAPSMLTMIPHLEHNKGSFYPKGGMISITNALYQLAIKKEIIFHFNSHVDRIIQNEKKVKGIVVGGKNKWADCVVSNMDVYFTYKYLLNDITSANKILQQERSSSAFIFYWGINQNFEQLSLHNIFFTNNYKEEFDHLFNKSGIYHDPTVYINISSTCEPGIQAPNGKQNWFVMVNAPANNGQDWETIGKKYKNSIIEKLNRILGTDIASLIEVEQTLSPVNIESKTSSYLGSLYGTSSNSKMAAFMRHPNFSNTIKGLYFVGGSVHPGGGIPLCLKSAKIMCEMVKDDYKMNS